MPKHNARHQFKGGQNNLPHPTSSVPAVPFSMPYFQGWKVVYEDFCKGMIFASDSNPYEITVEGVTPTATVGVNGAVLTTTAADNDSALLQWTTPTLLPGASTKKFYLETSAVVTAATMASSEIFLGFTSDESTTNFVGGTGVAWAFDDGIGFGKLDTATSLNFIARQSDVEQTLSLGATFATTVRTTLGCYSDGASYYVYKDGILLAQTAIATYNNDAPMGIAAYIKTGTAEVQTLTINYIMLATEL